MNNDSTIVLKEQIYSDFKQAISGIADSLSIGAEHVYEVLVKQQLVESITWLVILVTGIILAIISSKLLIKGAALENNKETYHLCPPHCISGAICAITCICLLIGGLFNLDTIITGFINPEYGAIMEIKQMIK